MQMQTPEAPEATTFEGTYTGTADQARRVRCDLEGIAGQCPAEDDMLLLTAELAANAILHSRSGYPGGEFTVRATLCPGEYAWVEVIDQGGAWTQGEGDSEHGRGLAIVAAIAGDGNWGIDGDAASRSAWFRLDWRQDRA